MVSQVSRSECCFVVAGTAARSFADTDDASDASDASAARGVDTALRLAAAWVKAWDAGDARTMAKLFAADGVYEDHAFQARFTGHSEIEAWVTITKQSIPDGRIEVQEIFGTSERVSIRWRFSGTDTGAFAPNLPSTGKSFVVPASSILVIDGGKLQQVSDYYNLADLLRQVGLPAGAYTPPEALNTR